MAKTKASRKIKCPKCEKYLMVEPTALATTCPHCKTAVTLKPPEAKAAPSPKATGIGCAVIGVPVLILAIVIGVSVANHKDPGPFSTSVDDVSIVNPASVKVLATVTNDGKTGGKTSCTVEAHDDSYAYTGFDDFDIGNIPAGGSKDFNGIITITGQGAQYVTKATVKCKAT